jgi:nitric oxide reductase subunit C
MVVSKPGVLERMPGTFKLGNMHPRYALLALSAAFLTYSFVLYLEPANRPAPVSPVGEGRLVWQKYNCQSCHQLYGLGGYLGPDLTKVMSAPNKGEPLLRAMLLAPPAPMPRFDLTEEEIDRLVAFLNATAGSGPSAPTDYIPLPTGMIQPK